MLTSRVDGRARVVRGYARGDAWYYPHLPRAARRHAGPSRTVGTEPLMDRVRSVTASALDPRPGAEPLERRDRIGAKGVIVDTPVGSGFGELEREHGGIEHNSGLAHDLPGSAPVFGGGVTVAGARGELSCESPGL